MEDLKSYVRNIWGDNKDKNPERTLLEQPDLWPKWPGTLRRVTIARFLCSARTSPMKRANWSPV